jgi:hypothetical protein
MSTTLSMISRQLEPSMKIESHVQLLHSGLSAASIRGMASSSAGGLPSGSCQTSSCPFCSSAVHARVRARSGTRLA